METILHIGTDKTGSTAIQQALFQNREWFHAQSVYIPGTGLGADNGHAALLERLDSASLDQLRTELESAEQQGFTAAIISWEGMCRYKPAQIRKLCSALRAFDLRLLVYLREQADIIQSAHLQWIEMNRNAIPVASLAEPSNLYQTLRKKLFLRLPGRDYHALLKRWLAARADMKISVRTFEASSLVTGDVVADFLAQLGLSIDDHFKRHENEVNPSIDVETALMLQSWRERSLSENELRTRMDIAIAIAETEPTRARYFFDRRAVHEVRRHYSRSNTAVSRIAQLDATKPLFTAKDCWSDEPLDTVKARAAARAKRAELETKIPTLWHSCAGAALANDIHLASGWSEIEPWGVWSEGSLSTCSFRIPHSVIRQTTDAIDLQIIGKYYGDNATSGISINDVDYGQVDLSKLGAKLRVTAEQTPPPGYLNIEIRHTAPASPYEMEGKEDRRALAFALSSVSYQTITQV